MIKRPAPGYLPAGYTPPQNAQVSFLGFLPIFILFDTFDKSMLIFMPLSWQRYFLCKQQ
jgi:hypothetical protein